MSIPLEAVVGELHIVGGARQSVTLPTAALVAPRRAARGRTGDILFVLVELRGPAPLPYQALMDRIEAAYWSTPGTVTSALRAALTAANDWLMDHNVQATVANRFHAGVSCAVLREAEILIAQAGPAAAYLAHHGQVERFPARDVVVPAMGISRGIEVRFSHASLSPGDTLLLCDSATAERTSEEAVTRSIVYTGVEAALQSLEKLAGAEGQGDLIALVVEGAAEEKAAAVRERKPPPREPEAPPVSSVAEPTPALEPQPEPEIADEAQTVAWAQRVGEWMARLHLRERTIAIGGSLAAGLTVAAQGLATILQRTLPEGTVRPREKGTDAALVIVALAIPIAVFVLVATAYTQQSTLARFQSLVSGARSEAAQAAALKEPSARRARWASALEQAKSALALQPDSAEARRVRDDAQRALDQLDIVVRLSTSLVWDFKSPGPHRLASQGLALFVLDRTIGSVFQLTLNESGDGVTDRGGPPVRVYRTQSVGDRQVGDLVDLVWMSAGGTRTRSSLLVLDNGGLLDYDPAWNLRAVSMGQGPVPTGARVMAAFGGNLYILDVGANQIWRYKPQGDGYAGAAEAYFDKPPGDLSNVIDMAIDGNVYLLAADGGIRKFFVGEEKAFAARGMADPIKRPVAVTVDTEARRGALYVADAGASRIVQLNTDGAFVRQLRATGDAFDALEDLSVDERNGRLYVISGSKLYAARLPAAP